MLIKLVVEAEDGRLAPPGSDELVGASIMLVVVVC